MIPNTSFFSNVVRAFQLERVEMKFLRFIVGSRNAFMSIEQHELKSDSEPPNSSNLPRYSLNSRRLCGLSSSFLRRCTLSRVSII